ncbi:hypothetical protein M406DRAFT_325789 [Cryphonectria parasitica EP155]|uniref:Uncharacterized protein n=1 Tax=Cryphonectria parasitica (strain ATCC 38755 / EP155) TaxID=660469 RepID=A0A9P4YBJ2_CRYP1|nr:uncharacterized protein M406DRAFT_325789 [Cryphonectria parasitica EP155]KAF3770341.1 hypothetical protein M406DRAFT_325789 [Cryphonectria parasitica EP155]
MSAAATPTKRRALGAIDVNVSRSPRSPSSLKLSIKGGVTVGGGSPLKKSPGVVLSRHATPSPPREKRTGTPKKKRPLEEAENVRPIVKKLCAGSPVKTSSPSKATRIPKVDTLLKPADEDDETPASQPATARRSISPDASSVFDNSTINTSQFTTITEPDTDAPITTTAPAVPVSGAAAASAVPDVIPNLPPPRPRRVPTREEFRQKAEILKLRLSLASYKVRTNQTDVPLDKLQVRPVPGMTRRRTPLPSMTAHTVERSTPVQYWYRSVEARRAPLPESRVAGRNTAEVDDGNNDEQQEEEEGRKVVGTVVAVGGRYCGPEGQQALPDLASVSTPRKTRDGWEEDRLTSSALKGGAAKGLLSLSQGSL